MPIDIVAVAYTAMVAGGGVLGYVKSNSIPSLAAGLFFGSVLGYGVYQTSQDPNNIAVFLGSSTVLGSVMAYRFYNTGKIMPAGVIAILSAIMVVRTITKYFSPTTVRPLKTE
ncbi:PREDICTED: transmembrane protein 14C [Wasmannia auropunctata]|uniref:transmembrane protein 14C n=1 Tax=Wasmannia auropunctata TaxID=64793 RepID=UPI0005EEAE8B|nr:PREDICTED: transmembrane protein 14C [Wasmannia auropunctata]XP_011690205.1 PREDICTED: transmembrane protein 14C [Wasmannia auropunctata]XP_011690206.1 PREDICTED: transmembrane protein 14C [Wasmannia auropunctata]XP_011690207.1 PREDICTED: transmembrane protein 14C [Wasmannia auropunctata]